MGIGKKITKGSMGGGVNISHNSKMSQSAKNQMSFPGGMPGPGNYGSTNNNVVGKGMAQYMAGEAVGMKKYGKHKGTAKMDPMHNGEPGVQKEDFQQFSDGAAKYGKSKGPAKDKKLPTYDAAYDRLSEEEKNQYREDKPGKVVEGSGRANFKKKAKKYNETKYGTEEPSKDSEKAGITREKLAENKKTKDKKEVETKSTKTETANKELKTTKENASQAQEARQDTRKSKRISKRANRVSKREDIRKGRAKAKADGLKGKAKRDAIKASKVAAKEKQAEANK